MANPLHEKNSWSLEKRCFAGKGIVLQKRGPTQWRRHRAGQGARKMLRTCAHPADAGFAPARSALPVHWAAAFARAAATLRLWLERNRTRRALDRLDDRMLADIGVTRAQARQESARPFWQPWLHW